MLKIVCIMLGGILTGFIFRKYNLNFISRTITILIWLLLFLLGTEVGMNKRIINGIGNLGGEALLLTLGGMAWMLWQFINKEGQ